MARRHSDEHNSPGLHRLAGKRRMAAMCGALRLQTVGVAALSVLVWAGPGSAQRAPEQSGSADSASAAPAPQGNGQGQPQESKPQESKPDPKPVDQRVAGKVLDRDGNAVAKVAIRFAGPKKERVWTDPKGDFSFTGPPGDYVITIEVGGHAHEFKVKVEDKQLKPSTLVIEPELFP